MNTKAGRLYEFGPFRLDVCEHRLLYGQEIVALTPKVFETLLVLIQHSGHIMEKNELMMTLWPDSFVEESSLTQNISLLRKALSEAGEQQFIETVPKLGYRFVAPVKVVEVNGDGSANEAAVLPWRPETSSARDEVSDEELPDDKQRRPDGPLNHASLSRSETRARGLRRSLVLSTGATLLLLIMAGGGVYCGARRCGRRASTPKNGFALWPCCRSSHSRATAMMNF